MTLQVVFTFHYFRLKPCLGKCRDRHFCNLHSTILDSSPKDLIAVVSETFIYIPLF